MPLVAITSVQLTTPMRTVLQEASSEASTLVLRRAVPQRNRQLLNSLFMIRRSRGRSFIVEFGVFMHRPATLRSRLLAKAHQCDRLLHCSDPDVIPARSARPKPATTAP